MSSSLRGWLGVHMSSSYLPRSLSFMPTSKSPPLTFSAGIQHLHFSPLLLSYFLVVFRHRLACTLHILLLISFCLNLTTNMLTPSSPSLVGICPSFLSFILPLFLVSLTSHPLLSLQSCPRLLLWFLSASSFTFSQWQAATPSTFSKWQPPPSPPPLLPSSSLLNFLVLLPLLVASLFFF